MKWWRKGGRSITSLVMLDWSRSSWQQLSVCKSASRQTELESVSRAENSRLLEKTINETDAGSLVWDMFCCRAIEYKLLSLTYKVLTTSQPDYLHNLISVQSSGRTRSSSVVTLARPSVSSSLQITNRSFRYASHHLWNQLPSSFRQPHCVHSPPGSPHPTCITSSQSSPSFSPSVTPSTFHSRLKTHLFHKSFPP